MRNLLFYVTFAAMTSMVSAELMFISDIVTPRADPESCLRETSEESCEGIRGCNWTFGQCFYVVEEGCGFVQDDADACNRMSNCVWMSDVRDRARGQCFEKDFVRLDGSCSTAGLVIQSKSSCNSIHGCSWQTEEDTELCGVARTQLECDSFDTRSTCQQAGCVFRETRQGETTCTGRWEFSFLRSLRKMEGGEAKKLIQEEFGDAYSVQLVRKNKRKNRKRQRIRNPKRIRLILNKKGLVRGIPKFG